MALVQLFIPSEIARATVSSIGEAGCVQFLDVHPIEAGQELTEQLNANVSAFQRHFVKEIRRADEMERRLRIINFFGEFLIPGFLATHVDTSGIRTRQLTQPETVRAPSAHELDELDEVTARCEQRVAHLLDSKETLERRHAELIEFRHVLRETASFFNVLAEKGFC
jgi:V-type H+-transporting ATPase subunit a